MIVNGKQMTITWHVDDLKRSHVDAYESKKVIEWMKGIYGSYTKEYHEKKQDCLGIPLNFSGWIFQGENSGLPEEDFV